MIRPADKWDVVTLHEWISEPEAIRLSLRQQETAFETHKEWFKSALKNEDIKIYVIEPMKGFIRLQRDGKIAVISIYVCPKHRQRGIAKKALKQAMSDFKSKKYQARVMLGNEPSIRLFESLGFKRRAEIDGQVFYEN